ncbi:hypothetical protein BT96DRAFT_1009327 [Gymnopus androsaceus JB14]|uniref:Carboxylesterase type B domain-containing protein n=1 Tax=Gymnopus androsaceus JB14 TaxID=1447944 RepID=A0A6A4GCW3_9AGAR|nr:hypothetical protein BT96DRAFT_1009327 [Gymnopus androsaceus JB14]
MSALTIDYDLWASLKDESRPIEKPELGSKRPARSTDMDKATVFGVNAGAIMTAVQLLNPDFSKFARATILQSGSAALALTYGPLYQQVDWDNFVAGVPGCENIFSTDSTFECLRSVNTSAISMAAAALSELYPPIPALGSPFNTGNDTFGTNPGYKIAAAIIWDLSFQSQRRFWTQTTSNAGVKTFEYLFAQPLPENPPFLGDPNDGKGVSRPTWEQYTLQNQACQTTQRYAMLNLHLQAVIQLNANATTMIPDDFRKE